MPVEVMNSLEEDVILYKNTYLGISRLPSPATVCSLEETTSEIPKVLEDLLNKVEVELDHEERSQICQLIKNHQDVFSLPGQPSHRSCVI